MKGERSLTGSKLHPYNLSDDELLAIGRLVRACADFDDIITGYLCSLAAITPGRAIILLGRMNVSTKLKMAEAFAKTSGETAMALHKECFDNEHYHGIIRCRNTVAHGVLLGKTDDGRIAFMVQETADISTDSVTLTVDAYPGAVFAEMADMAERVIPQLETRLKLRAWREKRLLRGIGPHPKARPPRKPSTKPKRQPRS